MTQVLSNLLQDGFGSLDDLPENVRNDMLLELAKLASEGKLSGKVLPSWSIDRWEEGLLRLSSWNAGETLQRAGSKPIRFASGDESER